MEHDETGTSLSKIIALGQRLSQFDVKMQISTALALIYVAKFQDRPEGVTTADLQKWLGVSSAAASRNSYYWGDGTQDMPNAGFGLIRVEMDPMDRRKRVLRLTPRGEAFVNQLKGIVDGST
ncbi:hypothetical protein [Shimia sp.]|uniref:hypothetical protein n=1 Tax=Shimia sp. TaxID=1954381 RepID=UPI003BACA96D